MCFLKHISLGRKTKLYESGDTSTTSGYDNVYVDKAMLLGTVTKRQHLPSILLLEPYYRNQ